uniref:C2 domain-containing protein n=1 Tax=Oryza punctata TaxID=4537 RepID=A0A0E0K0G4_ORYPU
MDHRWWLLQPRRRPEPAAIDITWVSCRGVRSSVPFHTPCLYASIYLHHPSSSSSCGRRPHRVKTATDRTGGGNPEWDAPLRLYYLPSSSSSSSSSGEREAAPAAASPPASDDNKEEEEEEDDCRRLLLRFELKSEVAVIGDVLSATAAVPVSELVADGRTRRVSYQLAGPDGKHPNGVISFSYAFHAADTSSSSSPSSDADDDRRSTTTTTTTSSGSECEYSITPPWSAASRAITLPPPPSSSTMYPAIDWPPTEQVIPMLLYPPAKPHITAVVKGSTCYPPPPPPTPPVEPVAVFAPPSPACGVYYPPTVREPVSSSGMYPKVDLDIPVSCYPPPPTATMYGGGCGYAAAPELDGRFLHG